MSAIPAVLLVVADDDRAVVRPLLAALARAECELVDDVLVAESAVVVASPRAAASARVGEALRRWVARRGSGATVVVLLDGSIVWADEADALDVGATTALPPTVTFETRPLWLDARAGLTGELTARVVAALAPGSHDVGDVAIGVAPVAPGAGADARSAPTRRGRRSLAVAVVALAILAVVASVVVLVVREADDAPALLPDTAPRGDSRDWLLASIALVLGLVVGAAVASWWSRRRTSPTAPPATRPLPPPRQDGRRPLVFISHDVDTDHDLALRFAGDLRADADVWMAPESIATGESWLTSIERGLGTCQIFVALLSRAALASPWVIKEVQAAIDLEVRRRLRLVPLQVEDCELPLLLRTYQAASLADGYEHVIAHTRHLVRTA